MKVTAKYPLQQVFDIIDSEDREKVWFSAKSKSIDPVIEVYSKTSAPKTITEAQLYILAGLKALTRLNFVQRTIQWNNPKCIADVYGLIYDKRPWYVKFMIEDGLLEQISFHPPKAELKTIGGLLIPKGF